MLKVSPSLIPPNPNSNLPTTTTAHAHTAAVMEHMVSVLPPDKLLAFEEAYFEHFGRDAVLPVSAAQGALDGLHALLGTPPWWVTLGCFTLSIRLALVPLTVYSARSVARLSLVLSRS